MPKHDYPFSLCLKGAAGLSYEIELLAQARITPEDRNEQGVIVTPATCLIENICSYGADGKPVKHLTFDTLFWNNRSLIDSVYADWKAGQG